jgi:flagellar M-ring protein FliF
VDADTGTPFIQKSASSGRLSFNFDEELAGAAVRAIEPVVGAEHVRASVHVEYDLSTSEDTSETYDPKSAVAVSQQHSEEIAGGGSPGGVPGTASNLPQNGAPNTAVVTAMDNQSSKSDSTTYAVNRSTKHVVQPAGRVRRITAAILVDDAVESNMENGKPAGSTRRKRNPEEMAAIEKLARAAIGVDEQRGDLLAVENLSFQTIAPERLAAPTRFERVRQMVQPWTQVLRYLAITLLFLVVYALVLRPVKKQALQAFHEIPAQIAKASQPLPAAEAANIELPAANEEGTRAALIRKQLIDRIKAEPSAASRLVQTWIHEPKK